MAKTPPPSATPYGIRTQILLGLVLVTLGAVLSTGYLALWAGGSSLRIQRECYRPNAYARVIDTYGRVERIVNNYANISFNFGPTLISWLAEQHPETYARIIAADRLSGCLRRHAGCRVSRGYPHNLPSSRGCR